MRDQLNQVGWLFELATSISPKFGYDDFAPEQFSFDKPDVPDGSIRNLRAVYASTTSTREIRAMVDPEEKQLTRNAHAFITWLSRIGWRICSDDGSGVWTPLVMRTSTLILLYDRHLSRKTPQDYIYGQHITQEDWDDWTKKQRRLAVNERECIAPISSRETMELLQRLLDDELIIDSARGEVAVHLEYMKP